MQWLLNMNIQFRNIQFTELVYQVTTEKQDVTKSLHTSFDIKSIFPDEAHRRFNIEFIIELKNDLFHLKVKSIAHFTTEDPIDDAFKQSSFVKANAPAIAFPYVRAFISNLTLNSGYNPIVLPAVNFIKLAEKRA